MFLNILKTAVFLSLFANLVYGANVSTNLNMAFWYDNVPPTKNDKHFFNKVTKALNVLEGNNKILKDKAQENSISVVDNQYARDMLSDRLEHFKVNNGFFYDLEKAQLILSIKMIANHCKVTSSCNSQMANQGIDQLIQHAIKTTKQGRNLRQRQQIENRNNLLMASLVGAVIVNTISNIVNSSNNYSYADSNNLSPASQNIDPISNKNSSKRKKENISKGIKHIKNNGKIGGVATYLITCKSGKSTVIKKLKGSWHTGFLGDMGHKFDNWSKTEVGKYICTN